MRKMFVIIVLLCILLTSCAQNIECSSEVYNELTGTFYEEWENTIQTSLTRFPGNLAPIITDLERVKGEYEKLDIPDCYQPAHEKFLSAMEYDLQGVMEFDQTGDVSDQFQLADAEFAAALEELKKLDE